MFLLAILVLQSNAGLQPNGVPVSRASVHPARTATFASVARKRKSVADNVAHNLATDDTAASLSAPETWRWLGGNGNVVPSFATVVSTIKEIEHERSDIEVHVGCDSAVQAPVSFHLVPSHLLAPLAALPSSSRFAI